MKLFINEIHEDWICNRIRSEFVKAHDFNNDNYLVDDVSEADVVWLLFGWGWMNISPKILENRKVILTVHHIDPEKINKSEFLIRDSYVDFYHVPNYKVIDFFPREIDRSKIKVIPYWYDQDVWMPHDLNLSEDKLVVGSFQRDTEGFDLITPKLSKGPDLFCDIVETLNTKYIKCQVILAGYRRQYVMSRLEKAGIEFEYHEKASLNKVMNLYSKLDLYLVTSRHEGGPQAILEASATRTPILSTNVGMAEDVLHEKCVLDFSKEDFIASVLSSRHTMFIDNNFENVQEFELKKLYKKYINLFLL